MITQENIPYTADEIKAMVKTCEKYNKALERAKDMLAYKEVRQEDMEYLFPELEESEDERIRREIIDFLRLPHHQFVGKRYHEKKWIAWLEKQGEQPTDKVEPKFEPQFKVGDWITDGYIYYKITEILDDRYIIESKYDKRGAILFEYENRYHLWTIEDAKDGDVLVNDTNIFIFHFLNSTRLMGYCHINIDNGRFYDDIGKNECFCLIDAVVNPATKEQRDLLFRKMKEAGCEWDSEKKELKKIEVASKESDDETIRKTLIEYIKGIKSWNYFLGISKEQMITWLEKQGDNKEFDDEWEVSTGLYKCIKRMFDGTPEGKLLFETGNLYKCISKHAIAEFESSYGHSVFLIDPVVRKHFIKVEDTTEKQDEQKSNSQMEKCSKCQFVYTGYCNGTCILENNEQKPADKIEPKFKIGDWM